MRKLEQYLKEEISLTGLSADAPDAIPTDLDDPVGSTIIGGRMKSYYQDNRISGPIKNHKYAEDDGDSWNWDDFKYAQPMGSEDSYSNTLYGLDKLLGDRLWKNINRKPAELHPEKKPMYRDSQVKQETEPKPNPQEKDKNIPDQPEKKDKKELGKLPNVDTHGKSKEVGMNERIDYLLEKFLTARNSYNGYQEIFENPTKRELRDTYNKRQELRFIADAKRKKVYVFPVTMYHRETWDEYIAPALGDNRKMYKDETLFGGAIEGGGVENWGFRDGLYKTEVLSEWVLHPEIWKFAQKWFDVMGWIERREEELEDEASWA